MTTAGRRAAAQPSETAHRATEGAVPPAELTIVETRVFRGPNYWSLRAGHPAARRPRRARGVPVQHDPRLHRRRCSRCCPTLGEPRLLARPRAAASSTGSRRAPGSATSPSTSRSSSSTWPGTDVRRGKTRATGEPGQYNVHLRVRARRRSASRPAGWPSRLVNHLVDARRPGRFDFAPELERLIRLAERAGVRALDPGAHRRGGLPRHPVHPARTSSRSSSSATASTSSASGRR